MKTKELINQIVSLEKTIKIKAKQKLNASIIDYDVYVDNINYYESYVDIYCIEKTNHDCPDSFSITLSLDEIDMDNESWDKYILLLTEEKIEKDKIKEQKLQEAKLKEKEKQFEKLKIELNK